VIKRERDLETLLTKITVVPTYVHEAPRTFKANLIGRGVRRVRTFLSETPQRVRRASEFLRRFTTPSRDSSLIRDSSLLTPENSIRSVSRFEIRESNKKTLSPPQQRTTPVKPIEIRTLTSGSSPSDSIAPTNLKDRRSVSVPSSTLAHTATVWTSTSSLSK